MGNGTCIIGGTFTYVHAGHLRLFAKAEKFRKITIGLTSGAYVRSHKLYPSFPYSKRLAGLKSALAKAGLLSRACIERIDDEIGMADRAPADAIIVSEETVEGARRINAMRKKRGKPSLKVISVPLAYAGNLKKISCADIFSGKIDLQGKPLKPLSIRAATSNPTKLAGARRALRSVFGRNFALFGAAEKSGVANHPFDEETFAGAKNRAHAAWERAWGRGKGTNALAGARGSAANAGSRAKRGCDYSLGMESGLFELEEGIFVDITVCCVYDGEKESYGTGAGFAVPAWMARRIRGKSDLTAVLREFSGIEDIGRKQGAVGWFSDGMLHRSLQVEQAVANAFVPRIAEAKKGIRY